MEASLVAHATIIAVQRKYTVKNKPNTSLNIGLIYYYISPCHLVYIMSYYFLGSVVVQLTTLQWRHLTDRCTLLLANIFHTFLGASVY